MIDGDIVLTVGTVAWMAGDVVLINVAVVLIACHVELIDCAVVLIGGTDTDKWCYRNDK